MNINGMPNNSTVIEMNPQDLFWILTAEGPVWSDIIGLDAVLKMLMEKKGMPKPGYYFKNCAAIHSYFCPHTFMLDLAHALHAPIDQVHPEFCANMNHQQQMPQMPNNEIHVANHDDDDSNPDPDL
jgi:hypothetical protein